MTSVLDAVLFFLYILLQGIPLAGTTILLTRGEIFTGLRMRFEPWPKLHYWIRCPLCAGAWIGAVGHILVALALGFTDPAWLLLGALASGTGVPLISATVDGVMKKPSPIQKPKSPGTGQAVDES